MICAAWCQTGAGAGGAAEAGGVVKDRGDRERDHGTDAGAVMNKAGHGILPSVSPDPCVENLDPLNDGPAGSIIA